MSINPASLSQFSQVQTQQQASLAVVNQSQDIAQQQGAAAISLIEDSVELANQAPTTPAPSTASTSSSESTSAPPASEPGLGASLDVSG